MRHYQNFDKIDSFLKPVLNNFNLGSFITIIVIWGRGLLMRGLVLCIKSIDLGDILIVGSSRIHQSKSWYYLETFQTVNLFCKKLPHK